jgi:hypothetical protein
VSREAEEEEERARGFEERVELLDWFEAEVEVDEV